MTDNQLDGQSDGQAKENIDGDREFFLFWGSCLKKAVEAVHGGERSSPCCGKFSPAK